MTGKKRQILGASLLIAITLVWIWGNSLLPAEASRALSGSVQDFVGQILGLPPDTGGTGEGLLRKIAHLSEFAVLGAEIAMLICLVARKASPWVVLGLWLLCGLGAAVFDETIQLWSPGRAAMVQDVWIDMAGFVVGGGFFLLVRELMNKLHRMRRSKK